MRRIVWGGLVGFSAAMVLSGCSSGIGRPVQEITAVTAQDGVQHVEVEAHSFYFEPNRIVVKKDVPVEITIKNVALFVPHNLTCNAPEAHVQLNQNLGMFAGRKKRQTFTPTEAGEFPFYCHVDAHGKKKGMKGTLVVTP